MSEQDLTAEDIDSLAGEYVLGTLTPDMRRQVQERMASDMVLRGAVARWEQRLLPLNALAQPIAPSSGLWPRIAATLQFSVEQQPQPASQGVSWQSLWQSLALWRGLAAAGFVCAVLLGGLFSQRTVPADYVVVLVAPGSSDPGWMIQAVGTEVVELTPLAVMRVPEGRALEFWTKADSWSSPVSLGLVAPGQSLRVRLSDLPPLQANQLFELTLEPATGSPTGKPTGPIQAIGRAVRL